MPATEGHHLHYSQCCQTFHACKSTVSSSVSSEVQNSKKGSVVPPSSSVPQPSRRTVSGTSNSFPKSLRCTSALELGDSLTDKLGETLEYLRAQVDLWAFFTPLAYPTRTPSCWYRFPEAQVASSASPLAQPFPWTNSRQTMSANSNNKNTNNK